MGGALNDPVRKVAVCGGSGADFWKEALGAGADVYVTGDVKYHTAQDMLAAGLKFVDPGHYGTEAVILPVLQRFLARRCREKNMDVEILLAQTNTDPFAYL
ncbi:MAG: putative GTP cyclohydrolase 1 type 2 [Firmicutes bacterium ADurb.Bin456]|nr:MAG: putative GTP cyclohydrolase 1 type 2 [Firmicutes bacterium ADurb.Bin456]